MNITIAGEFDVNNPTHLATNEALTHAGDVLSVVISPQWISTAKLTNADIENSPGVIIAPGSPYANMDRAIDAIRMARELGIPLLGTCGGFQHIILEYARNVLGCEDAQHAEYDPYASDLFISKLSCSLVGREMELNFVEGSQVAGYYGGLKAVESFYCNFGVAPERADEIRAGALKVVGSDTEGEIRVVELPGHPFFVGTLYVPQTRSLPGQPHPLILGFVHAALSSQKVASAS